MKNDERTTAMEVDAEKLSVAVLIPCYNEERAIHAVVTRFRGVLPKAAIYVYDNNSSDKTIEVAQAAGAQVGVEKRQGKGNVVRRMFSDIEADVYILVDGDNTYEAEAAPRMIDLLVSHGLDMVTGCRVTESVKAYRFGHQLGNQLFTNLIALIFGRQTRDMLTGYRVFSRRFVKSFPALSLGFEIETELTVHALELRMPIMDVNTNYGDRPPGSHSKLDTLGDGLRILRMITQLVKEERPFQFFGSAALVLCFLSLALAYPVVVEFFNSGLVPRLPTAVLAAAVMIVSVLSFFTGLILDTVTHGRREIRRLAYLSIAGTSTLDREHKFRLKPNG